MEQYHLLKIKQEHYHIGLFISLGDVSLMRERGLVFRNFLGILVVILSMLTCSFFIILYSLEWGAKRANEWLMT